MRSPKTFCSKYGCASAYPARCPCNFGFSGSELKTLCLPDTTSFGAAVSDSRQELAGASVKKPEEREFVVDSRASMHMLSKKDLNSADLETVLVSSNTTTVIAANEEVQPNEEATVYVKCLE